jgi:glutamate-1-semialdehyde 2,1-aminomutase
MPYHLVVEKLGSSPRCKEIYERESARFLETHAESRRLYERAYQVMPDGVPSGVCVVDPFPMAVARGDGARVWDIDGNEYVDYHNGFGTSVFGHAHPAITAAIQEQAARGTHFGAMTEAAEQWASTMCQRYGLHWLRFHSSGTEAVADAIRLARAASGKQKVVKVEGCYHGTSEPALVSNSWEHATDALLPGQMPTPAPNSKGLSSGVAEDLVIVPFNDLERVEEALKDGEVGTFLLEPVLFNVGAIFPEPGYLEGLRELCDRYDTLLIFDEVKTGVTVAWGGAEELFGVRPDLKVFGKGIGGGLPVGAVGDCRGDMRQLVEDWEVPLGGTFSGNPLVATAGQVALTEVLVPEAYGQMQAHLERLTAGLKDVISEYQLPAYVIGAGAKGCVVWAGEEHLRDLRDYCVRFDGEVADTLWLYLVNRGLFLAPGQDEQWTHSIAHGDAEADLFISLMRAFAAELRA